ncbi:MAG TPA: phosphate ABC transporter substrate-binding/OmpA family protein [Steroidobacteraceae bacterium]|nr:phosphate ABC transporter substrate-binding/OmpA family protein [Steroidobacteraceae bacterium]
MTPLISPRLRCRGSAAGNLITLLLLIGIIGLGVYLWLGKGAKDQPAGAAPAGTASSAAQSAPDGAAPTPIEPVDGSPTLEAAATYQPKDGVLQIDISEYAGYGGLIVANGGLEPNPDSFFAKEYGFKVKISMSESETWSPLNNGRLAATATTTDALAVLGRQFEAVVPVQIGYSRGADMVVVDRGIGSVNQLAGKTVGASQFNESEFFIRYLAQEAGVPVVVLRDLDSRPAPGELGLVFYEDAFVACDAYEHELAREQPRLNGCIGWTPRTDEVVEKSGGKAKVLVSNRNLLVIADILAVNRGFAKEHPDMVRGLVHGILEGNRRLRDQQAANIGVVAKAFGWSEAEARDELAHVHLANLPENLAFFSGTIDSAGSFGGIFQSSVLAYGAVLKNPTDAARFADTSALDALARKGLYADQRIAIAPIKTATQASLEGDPLLSKDIRFFFEPNSAVLDKDAKQNLDYLDTIKRFLQVSPGSIVVLRGHVDNARVNEFREQGGEQLVNNMALKAMELSRQRAVAVSEALRNRYKDLDAARIETIGRGWQEPAGTDSDMNRRVEVQWFTLE